MNPDLGPGCRYLADLVAAGAMAGEALVSLSLDCLGLMTHEDRLAALLLLTRAGQPPLDLLARLEAQQRQQQEATRHRQVQQPQQQQQQPQQQRKGGKKGKGAANHHHHHQQQQEEEEEQQQLEGWPLDDTTELEIEVLEARARGASAPFALQSTGARKHTCRAQRPKGPPPSPPSFPPSALKREIVAEHIVRVF